MTAKAGVASTIAATAAPSESVNVGSKPYAASARASRCRDSASPSSNSTVRSGRAMRLALTPVASSHTGSNGSAMFATSERSTLVK